MQFFTLADHIIFVALVFVLPVFALVRVKPQARHIPKDQRVKIQLYWLNSLVLWIGALIVIAAWYFSGRSMSDLGFRMPSPAWLPDVAILVAIFLLLYMFDTFAGWVEQRENEAAAILPATWREYAHFGSIVSFSAAFCEEVIFRGFLISYLVLLFRDTYSPEWLAIVLSAVVFALVHAYQGWTAMVKIFILTIMFGAMFVLTDSLLIVVLLHFFIDCLGGLLATVSSLYEEKKRSGTASGMWQV